MAALLEKGQLEEGLLPHAHSHGANGHAHGEHEDNHHGHSHGLSKAKDSKAKAAAASKDARWKLFLAMGFCILFMIAEVIGGYFAHSLAIMTDAAHLLSDVAAFSISLFAVWLAERPPTQRATFGFHRIEIFGAVLSVFLIWILTGVLLFEAVQRIITPEEVDGKIMFFTALAGVVVNLSMMKILHQGGHGHSHGGDAHGHSHGGDSEGNINVRAAFIHTVGDLVQSIGVLIAAAIIWAQPSAHLADPICTFLFSILVLFTTFGIMKSAYSSLLNSVPTSVSFQDIARDLSAIPGVANIHDLHIWSFGTDRVAMTVHLVADDRHGALLAAQKIAAEAGIGHSTIQIEQCGSKDVKNCYEFNEHIGACALVMNEKSAAPRAHSHGSATAPTLALTSGYALLDAHGGGGGGGAGKTPLHRGGSTGIALQVIDRPDEFTRHSGPTGCGSLVSPGGGASGGGHAHDHDTHGHSHGGHADDSHGHSHGGAACTGHDAAPEVDHGHSHGTPDEESHGHSHGGEICTGHGAAEVALGGHDEVNHADDSHGHSHGGAACTGHDAAPEVDHGHSRGTTEEESHGHSHGGHADESRSHSHGDYADESRSHSHGDHAEESHGHSHGGEACTGHSDAAVAEDVTTPLVATGGGASDERGSVKPKPKKGGKKH